MTAGFEVAALTVLRQALGPSAQFRDGQFEAIEALVKQRNRLLVVQRTGWGKSAVYFVATRMLRDKGAGTTIIVSPLLALMRDQIDAASRLNLHAGTINSSNKEDWERTEAALLDGKVDLLLVSPERFNNSDFRDRLLGPLTRNAGLLVIDEAHCISDWGHDFRPDYRRLVQVLEHLPSGVPVLCTTATANDRVVEDIRHQLGAELTVIRGSLDRDLVFVIHFQSPDSPVAYYQQVGRAGRAVDHADVVLLSGQRDEDIWRYFLERGLPVQWHAEQVVDYLDTEADWVGLRDIEMNVNMPSSRITGLLKVLDVEGAVEKQQSKYRRTLRPWSFDSARIERVRKARLAEHQAMRDYATASECRMRFLRDALDDDNVSACGRCDNCTGNRYDPRTDPKLIAQALTFIRGRPITIEPARDG